MGAGKTGNGDLDGKAKKVISGIVLTKDTYKSAYQYSIVMNGEVHYNVAVTNCAKVAWKGTEMVVIDGVRKLGS